VTSPRTHFRLFWERTRRALRSLSAAQLANRLRRLRLRRWFARLARHAIENDPGPEGLRGWFPVQVDLDAGAVGWIPGEALSLRRGLFYETLFPVLSASPPIAARRTDLKALKSVGADLELDPSGFVFHVSRCGSTLLGNMLLASPRNLVIQEAEAVNAVLRDFEGHLPESEQVELLRGVVSAYGRYAPAPDGRFYLKFSSWNVLRLSLIRKAFPGVPCVFLYRDPVEVVVSNLLKPGTWVRDQINPRMGGHLVGTEPDAARRMSRADYCARVIDRYCRAALQHAGDGMLFVNYSQLDEDCFRRILDFFESSASEQEFRTMAAEMSFYSKGSAVKAHTGDRARKQRLAGPDVEALAARYTKEAYLELEKRRVAVKQGDEVRS
jgi:hypothetical protein